MMTDYKGLLYGLAFRKNVLVREATGTEPLTLETQPGYWFPARATATLYFDSHEDAFNVLDEQAVEPQPHTYKEA